MLLTNAVRVVVHRNIFACNCFMKELAVKPMKTRFRIPVLRAAQRRQRGSDQFHAAYGRVEAGLRLGFCWVGAGKRGQTFLRTGYRRQAFCGHATSGVSY